MGKLIESSKLCKLSVIALIGCYTVTLASLFLESKGIEHV